MISPSFYGFRDNDYYDCQINNRIFSAVCSGKPRETVVDWVFGDGCVKDAVIKTRKVDADTWVVADNEGTYLKARHGGK